MGNHFMLLLVFAVGHNFQSIGTRFIDYGVWGDHDVDICNYTDPFTVLVSALVSLSTRRTKDTLTIGETPVLT